jgi:hypothetical protein
MKAQLIRSVVAALALSGTLGAQARPDFAGTWEMDVTRSETIAQAVPVPPATVIITQTPTTLRIETRTGGNSAVQTFPLENVANPVPVGTSGREPTLAWEGNTLVTTALETEKGMTMTRTKRRTLDPTGKIMTVETTLTVHHAYATSTAKDVFRKVE